MKKTYYLNKNSSTPVTVTLIVEDNKIARGIAICSSKDQFNKKIGRAIAEGRAKKALRKQCTCPNSFIYRDEVINNISAIFYSKCTFRPKLTDFEQQLLSNVRK